MGRTVIWSAAIGVLNGEVRKTMIRKRQLRDNGAIYHLVKEELIPLARKSFPELNVSRKELNQRLGKGVTYVAVSDGKAVGFLHAEVKMKELWIDMLAVAPGNRGAGLGKSLMQKAERDGKKGGCTGASLFVDSSNESAQQFYLRLGYQHVRFVPEINCYHFSKSMAERPILLHRPAIG